MGFFFVCCNLVIWYDIASGFKSHNDQHWWKFSLHNFLFKLTSSISFNIVEDFLYILEITFLLLNFILQLERLASFFFYLIYFNISSLAYQTNDLWSPFDVTHGLWIRIVSHGIVGSHCIVASHSYPYRLKWTTILNW